MPNQKQTEQEVKKEISRRLQLQMGVGSVTYVEKYDDVPIFGGNSRRERCKEVIRKNLFAKVKLKTHLACVRYMR